MFGNKSISCLELVKVIIMGPTAFVQITSSMLVYEGHFIRLWVKLNLLFSMTITPLEHFSRYGRCLQECIVPEAFMLALSNPPYREHFSIYSQHIMLRLCLVTTRHGTCIFLFQKLMTSCNMRNVISYAIPIMQAYKLLIVIIMPWNSVGFVGPLS